MSRLEKLKHNPHNYKNLCNIFEVDPDTCSGCCWESLDDFTCKIPIYDRTKLIEVLFNVAS